MTNDRTGRTEFELRCRVPGTRCAAIMRMIDQGFDDETIAARFDVLRGDETHTCTAQDIAVYRKAHDGTLCPPMGTPFRTDGKDARDAAIMALYQMGKSARELQSLYGMTRSSIFRILRNQRKKNSY